MKDLSPRQAPMVVSLPKPSPALAGVSYRLAADNSLFYCTGSVWKYVGHSTDTEKTYLTKTAHGFIVGNCLFRTPAGAISKTGTPKEFLGIVETLVDADNCIIVTKGAIAGFASLTAGSYYFSASGVVKRTATGSSAERLDLERGVSYPVLYADTTTTGVVIPFEKDDSASLASFSSYLLSTFSMSVESTQVLYSYVNSIWAYATASSPLDSLYVAVAYVTHFTLIFYPAALMDGSGGPTFKYLTLLSRATLSGTDNAKVYLTSTGTLSLTPTDPTYPLVVGKILSNQVYFVKPYIDYNQTKLTLYKDGVKLSDSRGLNITGLKTSVDGAGLVTVAPTMPVSAEGSSIGLVENIDFRGFRTTAAAGTVRVDNIHTGETVKTQCHKVAHGFTVGTCVSHDGAAYYAFNSNMYLTFFGIVETVIDADNFIVVNEGLIEGLSGLEEDCTYTHGAQGQLVNADTLEDPTSLYDLMVGNSLFVLSALDAVSGNVFRDVGLTTSQATAKQNLTLLSVSSLLTSQKLYYATGGQYGYLPADSSDPSKYPSHLAIYSYQSGTTYTYVVPLSSFDWARQDYLDMGWMWNGKLPRPPLTAANGSKVYLGSDGSLTLTKPTNPLVVGVVSNNEVYFRPPYLDVSQIPSGGATGQVLAKSSGADGAVVWTDSGATKFTATITAHGASVGAFVCMDYFNPGSYCIQSAEYFYPSSVVGAVSRVVDVNTVEVVTAGVASGFTNLIPGNFYIQPYNDGVFGTLDSYAQANPERFNASNYRIFGVALTSTQMLLDFRDPTPDPNYVISTAYDLRGLPDAVTGQLLVYYNTDSPRWELASNMSSTTLATHVMSHIIPIPESSDGEGGTLPASYIGFMTDLQTLPEGDKVGPIGNYCTRLQGPDLSGPPSAPIYLGTDGQFTLTPTGKYRQVVGHLTSWGDTGGGWHVGWCSPVLEPPTASLPVFVQATAPTVPSNTPYTWFQTGLGDDGNGITLWVEDGQ